MNKTFIAFVFLSIAFYYLCMDNNPQLVFLTKRIQNIGNISKNTVFTKEYKFINSGKNTLIIEDIYKSCSCTNIKLSSNEVHPNGEGILLITVDTTAKIGDQEIVVHLIANTKEKDHVIRILFFVP
ncbi:MAG: DUF1573 domain-containing protein [Bacteroidales bacterium]